MSHQLGGERAGLINKEFDMMFMDKLVEDPEALTDLTTTEIIKEAGTEGIELIMWIALRASLGPKVNAVHRNYHIPISDTAAGVMVMECV